MTLADLDKRAAELVREYQKMQPPDGPHVAVFIRTFDDFGNVRVMAPAVNRATLASYLNKAADVLFGGERVKTTSVRFDKPN